MGPEPPGNEGQPMKTIVEVSSAPARHWVGDGFPVHGMFDYSGPGALQRSPFLLLDYAAPYEFTPTDARRGVGAHPHRGFETVTIVYDGEVEHRDSSGGGGIIGPGDVQWMTAGDGILHEEFHAPAFGRRGGRFEVAQLWVNLARKDKSTPARYQSLLRADIPVLPLEDDAGTLRLIAGDHAGTRGAAETFSPMRVWDLRLNAGKQVDLPQPDGWTTLVVALSGTVQLNDSAILRGPQVATLSNAGTGVRLEASGDARLLLLAGEPIREPVVGYGPFVMNSEAEIRQSILDYNRGRFGQLAG